MPKRNRLACRLLTLIPATVFWTSLGYAQDVDRGGEGNRATRIEEIIVTAQKREQNLQDVPISVTAFTDVEIRKSNIENLQDLQFYIPSLTLQAENLPITFLRGIGSSGFGIGFDASVTTHIDGIYIPRTSGGLAEFWDLERIEVIKGPQGTLFGRNTTGGTIHYITKMPTEKFEASAGVMVGNYGKRAINLAASGPLAGNIRGRVSAYKNDRDGFQRDPVRDREFRDEDIFGFRGALQLLWSSGDIVFRGDYVEQSDSGETFVRDDTRVSGDLLTVGLDGPQFYNYDVWGASATLSQDLGGSTFRAIASFRKSDLTHGFDNDGSSVFKLNAFFDEFSESFHGELQLLSNPEPTSKLDWIGGLFYFQEESEEEFRQIQLPPGLPCQQADVPDPTCPTIFNTFPDTLDTNAYAVFAQGTYKFTDAFRLTVGIRYSVEEKKFASAFFRDGAVLLPFIPEEDDWDAVTPKFILEYDIAEDVLLYGSVSRGFKSGSFSLANLGGGSVDPEYLWAYESGLKARWLNGDLTTNFSAYWYDFTDLQVQGFDPDVGFFLDSAGEARVRGVEAEIFAAPTDRLQLSFLAAYLDATFRKFTTLQGGMLVDLAGNTLPHAPELSASTALEYTVPIASLGEFSLRGEAQWKDEQFFRNDNVVVNPDATIVNAMLFYRPPGDRWTLSLFVKNAFDEQLYGFISPSGTRFTTDPAVRNVAIGVPRLWGFKIRYDFQ